MTAIFSTTVAQAQRDACDHDLRGRAISQASRQNTKRPGRHAPDGYVEPTKMGWPGTKCHFLDQIIAFERKKKMAALQVRPNTKRGGRGVRQHARLEEVTPIQFREAGCEFLLRAPDDVLFLGVRQAAGGDVCTTGCGWFDGGQCPAYRKLIEKEKLK